MASKYLGLDAEGIKGGDDLVEDEESQKKIQELEQKYQQELLDQEFLQSETHSKKFSANNTKEEYARRPWEWEELKDW
jgi:hypothetical protein